MLLTRQQIFEGGFESDSNGPVCKILPGFFLILAMIIKLREKFRQENQRSCPEKVAFHDNATAAQRAAKTREGALPQADTATTHEKRLIHWPA
jgi:hypothetical protein